MWLINHTSLRAFELPQLAQAGIAEVFTPKSFPYDEGNLSASIDAGTDRTLTIPADDLARLNREDWYGEPSMRAWEIVNRDFQVLFCAFFPRQLASVLRHFRGVIVLRAFGLAAEASYTDLIAKHLHPADSRRLWERVRHGDLLFGAGYANLAANEGADLQRAECLLPVGLASSGPQSSWTGDRREILFVCPRIGTSPYFAHIYERFRADFGDLPYRIGGAQPLPVKDPRVLGFVSQEQHAENMRALRAMFYHSREPRHLHYHPLEAVQAGMPLVFMAGGMLDRLGGIGLPGRCRSIRQARDLLRRLLDGDMALAERLRSTQGRLLATLTPDACVPYWQSGIARVLAAGQRAKPSRARKRIAVVVPISYRGGTLRGARLIAEALRLGSIAAGEPADIVLAHPDDPVAYGGKHAPEPLDGIPIVPFRWRELSARQARAMMRFAGHRWEPDADTYLAFDDSLASCDLWVVVSDRVRAPIVPLRPVVMMIFDYLQRYVDILPHGADLPFLRAARSAERVLVTTRFTEQDALQYGGIARERLVKVPMLAPELSAHRAQERRPVRRPYFMWTTNPAPHKNHAAAIEALAIYYTDLGGSLDCVVTGAGTQHIPTSPLPHLHPAQRRLAQSELLQERLSWAGELPDAAYREVLADAAFLWHPCLIDNGTFSVIEAARLGVPSLSSDYPAMREIDEQFRLHLAWMDPRDPVAMARSLRSMEDQMSERRRLLPAEKDLDGQGVDRLADAYWAAVRPCL
jgi:glycosyltransferase involved in cell wall biosynthesis